MLDLRRLKFSINIRLDIFPLDYKEPNEVWFGFLVNSDEPQRGSVIVALRKDEQQKKSGLHIGIGGQQWLAEPNNFEFVVMKWHRLNLQLDKAEVDGGLSLRAKVWLETESEPAEWMTEARFSAEQINLPARGVLLGTKASWGKKGNPRAGFDNLIITCGETRIPDRIFIQSADRISEGVLSLFKPELAEELRERVEQIRPQNPNYCGYDRALFLEMLALRNIARWAEARDKANELIALFPASPYTARMGGKDGRTEDQAAVEFSKCIQAYHDRNYDEARPLFLKFVEDYPNNWRRDHCQFLALESLYLMGNEDDFVEECNKVINQKLIGPPYNGKLLYLEVAILIRKKKGNEARNLLDFLEKDFPMSRLKDDFRQSRLESYIYDDTTPLVLRVFCQ